MDSATLEHIAGTFLPSRWHYYYARTKLATDPLYGAVVTALEGTTEPLLDLGCGIGLLPHYCRAHGVELGYLGVDNDQGKITLAREAATRAGLANARFATTDLAEGFPPHRGSVAILDVLQYLHPAEVVLLLGHAARSVSETGRMVIRTGMQDGSWRARVTRAADVVARAVRWMNASPRAYPTQQFLRQELAAHGLKAEFTPLWGRTPFNNWLVVARRN